MEIRLPRTKPFELPLQLLELEGQCVNSILGDYVSVHEDIVPQTCRRNTNLFPSPCGGGRCTTYRVKDTSAVYKLIDSQTTMISDKIGPKNLAHLTVKEQIRGDGTYNIDKIILMSKEEFSENLLE